MSLLKKMVNVKEFEVNVKKIIGVPGDDISSFFTVIYDTFEYFTASDDIIEKTRISLEEFETMTREITEILGEEESVRFFKAVYDALPKKTIKYLDVMVKVFEKTL